MHIDTFIRTPDEFCQPNGVIIPIGTLAAQPPDDCCRPHRGRCVLRPVGTRGAVGWMRGPCACPGGDATGWPHRTQTNPAATRTSTRPPPCSTSTPCPYRTQADIPNHSPIRLSKIIRGRFIGPRWIFPIQMNKLKGINSGPRSKYSFIEERSDHAGYHWCRDNWL
jgi:hypothetical protein